ncbi:MAG: hypothetical protein PHI15_05345 [Methanomicrobium sp.]|nr:hypothetical protein [Methanomicrobium sp.]
MQDARLRIFSIFLLSFSAFTSITGAGLVFIWWLFFSEREKSIPSVRIFLGFFFLTSAVAFFMEIRGFNGLFYFCKMIVILLVACWAFSHITSKDLLNFMTWMFGQKYGFELGLISAIALNKIKLTSEDYSRAKIAHSIKKTKIRWYDYISVLGNIFIWSLRDASQQGKILALRGYTFGGSMQPSFEKSKNDIIPAFLAITIFLFSFSTLVTYL